MVPLGLLSAAERAEIMEIRSGRRCEPAPAGPVGSNRCGRDRMEDMGVRAGKIVEVLSSGGPGPVLLKMDESRIALGRGIAMNILVRRIKK